MAAASLMKSVECTQSVPQSIESLFPPQSPPGGAMPPHHHHQSRQSAQSERSSSRRSYCVVVSTAGAESEQSQQDSERKMSAAPLPTRSPRQSPPSIAGGGRKIFNFFFQRGSNSKRTKQTAKSKQEQQTQRLSVSEDNLDRHNDPDLGSDANSSLTSLPDPIHNLERQISLPVELYAALNSTPPTAIPSGSWIKNDEVGEQSVVGSRAEIRPVDSSLHKSACIYYFNVISRPADLDPIAQPKTSTNLHFEPQRFNALSNEASESFSGATTSADESSNNKSKQLIQTFACSSNVERNRWMLYLKRLANPNRDNRRRVENCFQIWIQEAKGLLDANKYYCDILLDNVLHARTSAKRKLDMLFWGEEFDLSGLPDFDQLSIELWCQADDATSAYRSESSPSSLSRRRNPGSSPSRRSTLLTCARNSEDQSRRNKKSRMGRSRETDGSGVAHHSTASSKRAQLVARCCVHVVALTGTTRELESWYRAAAVPPSPGSQVNAATGPQQPGKRTAKYLHHNHTTQSGKTGGGSGEIQLRVKTRHCQLTVLPLSSYSRLHQLLRQFRPITAAASSMEALDSALLLCDLDSWLSVKSKADIAGSVLGLQQALGQASDFLVVLILHEVGKQADPNMVLRSNSIAMKATELHLRLNGQAYLDDLLTGFVKEVLACQTGTEVDPTRLPSPSRLTSNQSRLLALVESVWCRIVQSANHFPIKLRQVFSAVRQHIDSVYPPTGQANCTTSLSEHVLSACLFLRFICPAILSPSLFGLTSELPTDANIIRTFTLVAKCIQSLANFTLMNGPKEPYMAFINPFLANQLPHMRQFLANISAPPTQSTTIPQHQASSNSCADLYSTRLPANVDKRHGPMMQPTTYVASSNTSSGRPVGYNFAYAPACYSNTASGYPPNTMSSSVILMPNTDANPSNKGGRLGPSWSHHDGLSSNVRLHQNGEEVALFARQPVVRSKSGLPTSNGASQCHGTQLSSHQPTTNLRRTSYLPLPSLPLDASRCGAQGESGDGDHIDLALCLAMCHCQLSDALDTIPLEKLSPRLAQLKPILDEITYFISSGRDPPNAEWWRRRSGQSNVGVEMRKSTGTSAMPPTVTDLLLQHQASSPRQLIRPMDPAPMEQPVVAYRTTTNWKCGSSSRGEVVYSPPTTSPPLEGIETISAYPRTLAYVPTRHQQSVENGAAYAVISLNNNNSNQPQLQAPSQGRVYTTTTNQSSSSGYHSIGSTDFKPPQPLPLQSAAGVNPLYAVHQPVAATTLVRPEESQGQQHIYANIEGQRNCRLSAYLASLQPAASLDSLPSSLASASNRVIDLLVQGASSMEAGLDRSHVVARQHQQPARPKRSTATAAAAREDDQNGKTPTNDRREVKTASTTSSITTNGATDWYNLRSQLTASQDRVAAAQERLAVIEAERQTILRDCQAELERQSILVNNRSDPRSTLTPQTSTAAQPWPPSESSEQLSIEEDRESSLGRADRRLQDVDRQSNGSLSSGSQVKQTRLQKVSLHNSQPRMGASALASLTISCEASSAPSYSTPRGARRHRQPILVSEKSSYKFHKTSIHSSSSSSLALTDDAASDK